MHIDPAFLPALSIGPGDVTSAWSAIARGVREFAAREHLSPRELVVLLPFAQHLPLARAAWMAAQADGAQWLPRFETTQTLAAALVPAAPFAAGALAFDPVADRLQAAALLREAARDWPRRDPRGFELAVGRVVETAQGLARARLALPPALREAWLAEARAALGAGSGPGVQERALARVALEWSVTADVRRADALHRHRPAGWVLLRAGGRDALAEALLAQADVPVCRLDADLPLQPPWPSVVRCAVCDDFEDEAQRSAAQVLHHLERGERPVALIALDRVLLRRVRALLERQRIPVADETGWKLSTTRAGASVAGLLRAAARRASSDELLDWLKSGPRPWRGLDAFEAACRRYAWSAIARVDPARLEDAAAAALWSTWLQLAEPLRATRRLPLADWLQRLRESLQRAAVWEPLAADAAGAQVLQALRYRGASPLVAWGPQAAATPLDATEFRQWLDSVLEQVSFEPPAAGEGAAPVVVTPLARALLRPFAAAVCPGADAQHLGALAPPQALLGHALAAQLGVPTAAERRDAERQAFAQLLRLPRLSLLHRLRDGAEPLQPSALLQQIDFAAQRAGAPLAAAPDARVPCAVEARPQQRPAPSAAELLPDALSATGYEALRACPYRFFALKLLGLGEAEELDDALDKRDYGTWLHAVLHDFHQARDASRPQADAALLLSLAQQHQDRLARDDADFLPYAAGFEPLVVRYLAWLHAEEATGIAVRDTELPLRALPDELGFAGLRLRGTLDRVDAKPAAVGRTLRILDYKTSASATLRERVKQPLEDTQLAFYAALLASAEGRPPGGIEAAYLVLDGRDSPSLLPHPEVEASAAELLTGLASDLKRLRGGAALPALGEGSACVYCEARGLCRRDHFPARDEADA